MTAASSAADLSSDNVFVHQLLAGRDVANPAAARTKAEQTVFSTGKMMQNYMYLVGDPETRECLVFDGAYDPEGIDAEAGRLGYKVVGYVATHYHYDHIGRKEATRSPPLPGMSWFVARGVPAYIHEAELEQAAQQTGVEAASLTPVGDGQRLRVGGVTLRLLHTPGHSPGSVVAVVADSTGAERFAITGDTIFPGSCGRVDLPGSDIGAMYRSLQHKMVRLDDDLVLFPGHAYSGESSTVRREKREGLLRPGLSEAAWRRMMSQ